MFTRRSRWKQVMGGAIVASAGFAAGVLAPIDPIDDHVDRDCNGRDY